MPFIVRLIGTVVLALGAIFSFFFSIRSLRSSLRWSDYRLRRKYILRARGLLAFSVASALMAVIMLAAGKFMREPASPVTTLIPATLRIATTPLPLAGNTALSGRALVQSSPTFSVITPSPVNTSWGAASPTPVMPIAVQAMLKITTTPDLDVEFGRLRFSTEIDGYRLIAPGVSFYNPIRRMYVVFTYQPIRAILEWTALWYQNGQLKNVDTTSWSTSPAGIGIAGWARDAPQWQAGNYEVQLFVGTTWKASGTFTLEGEPPTATATALPTATSSRTATAIPTSTRTNTPVRTPTPLPTSTRTRLPTPTSVPTSTSPPRSTATGVTP